MNCTDAIGLLISHVVLPVPGPVAKHLETCESCRTFAEVLRKAPAELVAPPRVDLIKALLSRELRPVKPLPSDWALFAHLLLMLSAVLVVGSAFLGIHGWSSFVPYVRTIIFGALFFCLCVMAFAAVRQMAPAGGTLFAPLAGAAVAFSIFLAIISRALHWGHELTFVATGVHCLTIGAMYAAVSALLCWSMLRRGATLSSFAASAVGGVLSGLVGLAGLEILCPNANLAHVLVWHLSIVVLGLMGGWSLGIVAELRRR